MTPTNTVKHLGLCLDEHLLLSKQLNHITELNQAIGMLSKLENLYLPENSEDDIIFWVLLTFYIYYIYICIYICSYVCMYVCSGVTKHSPDGFGQTKYVFGWIKFPKCVCLVAQLGKQLPEKQILKIIIDILW